MSGAFAFLASEGPTIGSHNFGLDAAEGTGTGVVSARVIGGGHLLLLVPGDVAHDEAVNVQLHEQRVDGPA